MLADRYGHHQSGRIRVSDSDKNMAYPQHLRPSGCITGHPDRGLSATGDLDVVPTNAPPARAERLHHGFLPGESGREPTGRLCEPECVLALVLGETALGESRVLAENSLHTIDVGKIDAKAENPPPPNTDLKPSTTRI